MSQALLLPQLTAEMDEVSALYEARFAGKSRNTRNPDAMKDLCNRTRAVLGRIDAALLEGPPEELQALREAVHGSLEMYETEHKAILAARETGPDFAEAAELTGQANTVFARYARHFSGKPRAGRDLGLMSEMVDDLDGIATRLQELVRRGAGQGLKRDLDLIRQNLTLYRGERAEIEKAQHRAPTQSAEDEGNMLAGLANQQLQLYKLHFAGHSRLTRRPALLERVVAGLARIQGLMLALSHQGLAAEWHERNLSVVEGNLRMYQQELREIQKVRQQVPLSELLGLLSEEANGLFSEYEKNFAGKDRKTVTPQVLSDICDQLGEVARQMHAIRRVETSPDGDRNFEVVMDSLVTFEREYELIQQAQKPRPEAGKT